ncbi:unnamed protein product [Arctia plantaginis]|uniref:Uncharacterized protein n=1 Tax=Arctia plantaginis TaxID=874455 RepID=A0A8S0YU48_ARCPL|nr:unnamed protein product [Arctia plantaginis]
MSKLPETAPTAERPVYPASAELERGLDLVGLGWYNLRYCMTLLLVLLSSVMETVGTTILLPAAKCDLNISDKQRGLVFSIPYIVIAWAIIPLDFRIDVGIYTFRPWRLLAVIYSSFFILTSCLLIFGPESPKFLLSQGKPEAALKVLQIMYAANKRKQPEDFPMKSLPTPPTLKYKSVFASMKGHTMTLMKWQYFKYLLLNGSLLFGIFFVLNGINMWVFEVLNRILSNDSNDKIVCEVIMAHPQHNDEGLCDDSIDIAAFKINTMAQLFCSVIGLGISLAVTLIGKKLLLLTCFYLIGAFSIVLNHVTCDVLTAALISLFPLLALAIGPVNAYALQIFPTHIR